MATRSSGSRSGRSSGSDRAAPSRAAPGRATKEHRCQPAEELYPAPRRRPTRSDKSVEAFRDALERSVTLSRDRLQEVVDDAVRRGRMTRDDANELVSNMVTRGRSLHRRPGQGARAAAGAGAARDPVANRARRGGARPRPPAERRAPRATPRTRRWPRPTACAGEPGSRPEGRSRPTTSSPPPDQVPAGRPQPGRAAAGCATREKRGKARKSVLAAIERRLEVAPAQSAGETSSVAITVKSSSPPSVSASNSAASRRWPVAPSRAQPLARLGRGKPARPEPLSSAARQRVSSAQARR